MAEIYMLKNKITGKMYIGQTTQDTITRFGRHIADRKKFLNRPLYKDLDEYGYLNFDVIVLEECDNNSADQREQYYIKKYDTYNNGYNNNLGGTGKKIDDTEIRDLYLNKDFFVKEIAEQYGVCVDTIASSLKRSGVSIRRKNTRGKPILQYSLNGKFIQEFRSCREAGRALGDELKFSHIRECAWGHRSSAYGYKWEWK